ncbi:hypothetical protein GCM10017788_17250 [Amycolatopsis acidiphila]|nr:hypothetical protein GCM10017788_17250 [Amycolatopsis acidiphila]
MESRAERTRRRPSIGSSFARSRAVAGHGRYAGCRVGPARGLMLPLQAAPALGVVSSALACAMLALLTSRRVRYDGSGAEAGGGTGDLRLAEPGH